MATVVDQLFGKQATTSGTKPTVTTKTTAPVVQSIFGATKKVSQPTTTPPVVFPTTSEPEKKVQKQGLFQKAKDIVVKAVETYKKIPSTAQEVKMLETAIQPLVDKATQNPTVKNILTGIARRTSGTGILATITSVSPEVTFSEAYETFRKAQSIENDTLKEQFLTSLGDTSPQTALGVALNFVPIVGKPLSIAYWTAVSAGSELDEKGKVTPTNVAIDVALDSVLGRTLESLFKSTTRTLFNTVKKSFVAEGGTEVAQDLLKFANEYRLSTTQEGKDAIIQQAKEYFTSGQILVTAGVGGISGGGIAIVGSVLTPEQALKETLGTPKQETPESKEIIKVAIEAQQQGANVKITEKGAEITQEAPKVAPIEVVEEAKQKAEEGKVVEEELPYDPSRLEIRILNPNTGGNPSDKYEVQVRYKGFASEKKGFDTKEEAQKFMDNYEFKGMTTSVADDYAGSKFFGETYFKNLKVSPKPTNKGIESPQGLTPEVGVIRNSDIKTFFDKNYDKLSTSDQNKLSKIIYGMRGEYGGEAILKPDEERLLKRIMEEGRTMSKPVPVNIKTGKSAFKGGDVFPSYGEYSQEFGGYKAISQGMDMQGDYLRAVNDSITGKRTDLGKPTSQVIDEAKRIINTHSLNPETDLSNLNRAISQSGLTPEVSSVGKWVSVQDKGSIPGESPLLELKKGNKTTAGLFDSEDGGFYIKDTNGHFTRNPVTETTIFDTKEEAIKQFDKQQRFSSQGLTPEVKEKAKPKEVVAKKERPKVEKKPVEVKESRFTKPINEYLDKSYGKDIETAGKKQILEALSRTDGNAYLNYTPELNKKLSNPMGGIVDDSIEIRPALLYGGKTRNVFTDGYLLILNKNMAGEINDRFIEKEKASLVKEFQRDPEITFKEANKLADEKIKENIELYSGEKQYPPYKDIAPSEKGKLLEPKAIYSNIGTPVVIHDLDGEQVHIGADKIALFKKYFPELELYGTGSIKPVTVYNGKEMVGLIMPIRHDEVIYDLENPSTAKQPLASTDAYATSLENITESMDQFKVVRFPEMVRFAEQLMGRTPEVEPIRPRKHLGLVRGLFTPTLDGKITLNPTIFKDPKQASFTLAHEMGHLIDYLPDQVTSRGNLLGRIATMRKFLRQTFSGRDIEAQVDELIQERNDLREQRREDRSNRELLNQLKKINKEIAQLRSKDVIKNAEIKAELWEVSKKWRPLGKSKDSEYLKYRNSPEELYADAISVLLNDPMALKQSAPKFYDAFFKNLEAKPKVMDEYLKLQKLLHSTEEEILNQRLSDLDSDYAEGEAKGLAIDSEALNQKENLINIMSTLFNDKNAEINRRVNKYIKAGGIVDPKVNPIYDRAGLNYMEGFVKNFIADNFQGAKTLAEEVPNGWVNLGKILQLERAIYERGELANPRGYDPVEAQKTLDQLQNTMTPEEWASLQKAKEQFRSGVQKLIVYAEENGFYKPELIAQMKANPAYATFQVLDYFDTKVSSSVIHQKGTLKAIANPANSTIMKAITTLRAIRYNQSRDINLNFMETAFPEDITPARKRFTGKTIEYLPSKDRTQELVTVIRDGKLQGYYVPKEVGTILNFSNDNTMRQLGKLSKMLTGAGIYRPLFTSLNMGFQIFNLKKDFSRSWKNLPDRTVRQAVTSFFKLTGEYEKAIKPAWRRATGKPDTLIKEMENAELLGLTLNQLYGTPDPEDQQINRTLQKIGVLPQEEANSRFRTLVKPIIKIFDGVEIIGNFIETLPKVAGYKIIQAEQKAKVHYIRNYIGSPDFRVAGTATPITNNIFLFSNASKEGIKGDANLAFKKSPTRSAWWFKTSLDVVLPKLLLIAMAGGLLGDPFKKLLENVSEYDKTNYDIIPMGTDKNGKTIFIRVPKDQTGQFIGALVWKFANLLKPQDKQSLLSDIADIFGLWAGELPTTVPSIDGFVATLTYLSGKNPYDSFRNRLIIPETEFKAGFKYSFPIFLDWLSKNQGLNIVLPSYTPEGQISSLEKTLNLPVLSNIIGRFIKVTDYGKIEKQRIEQKKIEQESAVRTAEKKVQVEKAVNTFVSSEDQSPQAKQKAINDLIVKVLGHPVSSKEENTTANDITKRFNMGVITDRYDANVDNIISAQTNDQKASALKYLYEEDRKTFDLVMPILTQEGILSKDTLQKFQILLSTGNKKTSQLNPFKVRQAMASEKNMGNTKFEVWDLAKTGDGDGRIIFTKENESIPIRSSKGRDTDKIIMSHQVEIDAINKASKRFGVRAGLMVDIALQENSLKNTPHYPNDPTRTATGLFGITDATWRENLTRLKKLGVLSDNPSRENPNDNAMMSAYLLGEKKQISRWRAGGYHRKWSQFYTKDELKDYGNL